MNNGKEKHINCWISRDLLCIRENPL